VGVEGVRWKTKIWKGLDGSGCGVELSRVVGFSYNYLSSINPINTNDLPMSSEQNFRLVLFMDAGGRLDAWFKTEEELEEFIELELTNSHDTPKPH